MRAFTLALGTVASLFVLGFAASSQADGVTPVTDRDSAKRLLELQELQKTQLAPDARTIVDSMTNVGLEVQRSLAHPGVNVTVSPFSLSSAFGLVLNGVRGGTLSEVSSRLYGGMSPNRFNVGYQTLTRALADIDKANTLSFGNAVFTDRDTAVNTSYSQAVSRYLNARAEALNFRDAQDTVARINGYIEEQTHHMIKNMLQRPPSRAALVNAGYFKGTWAVKFDASRTDEEADFNTGRAKKKLPLMWQRGGTFLYHRGDGFQMASLAYKNGDFAMDLIVPDESSDALAATAKVQQQMTGDGYRAWIQQLSPTKIDLALPRFETEFKSEVTNYYRRVIPTAFSALADFGAMTRDSLSISDVIHATVLKVNEEGTEGSFATVITLRSASVRPAATPQVIANRPFLFVIRHTKSGTPLFVSTVYDPKALPKP